MHQMDRSATRSTLQFVALVVQACGVLTAVAGVVLLFVAGAMGRENPQAGGLFMLGLGCILTGVLLVGVGAIITLQLQVAADLEELVRWQRQRS